MTCLLVVQSPSMDAATRGGAQRGFVVLCLRRGRKCIRCRCCDSLLLVLKSTDSHVSRVIIRSQLLSRTHALSLSHWVTPAHVFPLSQNCRVHWITLPTHSRWLKARPKTEFHLTRSRSFLCPLVAGFHGLRFFFQFASFLLVHRCFFPLDRSRFLVACPWFSGTLVFFSLFLVSRSLCFSFVRSFECCLEVF